MFVISSSIPMCELKYIMSFIIVLFIWPMKDAMLELRNKSWKPECAGSFNMDWWNPGRFAPITCSPRVDSPWVVSPRKVSRFAPLNRYYIIIEEIFFDNFLEIIYLLVVCKKNNNSFILVYFCCQRSQVKLFLQNLQKQHTRTVKRLVFFMYQRKSA
jgi:hypothetical protein